MKKILCCPILTAGILLSIAAGASAATITHTRTVPLRELPWDNDLLIPKYDPSLYPGFSLKAIRVTAESAMQGTYTLSSGNRQVIYGQSISAITALMSVRGPLAGLTPSLDLNVSPRDTSVRGTLPPNSQITLNVQGNDRRSTSIDPVFFNIFQGSNENVTFQISGIDETTVSLTGPATQDTILNANLRLSVTYENDAPPLEIPDRPFGIGGLLFCGLAGLALKTARKRR